MLDCLKGIDTNTEKENKREGFEVEEETALLINDMENPYPEKLPENFTEDQKRQWLFGMEE